MLNIIDVLIGFFDEMDAEPIQPMPGPIFLNNSSGFDGKIT